MSLFTAICWNVNLLLPVQFELFVSSLRWCRLVHARSCTSRSVWQLPIVRREMATGVNTASLLSRLTRVCNHPVQIGRRIDEPSQVRWFWYAQIGPIPMHSIQAWVSQELYMLSPWFFLCNGTSSDAIDQAYNWLCEVCFWCVCSLEVVRQFHSQVRLMLCFLQVFRTELLSFALKIICMGYMHSNSFFYVKTHLPFCYPES